MAQLDLLHRHDLQLERTYLGCCIVDPSLLHDEHAQMPTEVFYSEKHRILWKEIQNQFRTNGSLDFVTLTVAYRARGDTIMPQEVLFPIMVEFDGTYHPTCAYAALYSDQLKRLYVDREKARAARDYERKISQGFNSQEARLELEAILRALDDTLDQPDEQTDEDLAAIIGGNSRYPTGFRDLDRRTGGFANPGLNIIAARPSVGKSAMARSIIRHAAQRGDRVVWYSKDQSENQILELEIARLRNTSTTAVRSMSQPDLLEAIREVRRVTWNNRVHLIDEPIPLGELLTVIRTNQPQLVVIDYLQILDTGHDDEYESITFASKALKTLAFQMRIPVLALAQFNRAHRHGSVPTMNNIRGSGQIEQDADQIYALERDTNRPSEDEQNADLYVLKNKVGPTAKIELHWRAKWASYENAAPKGFS